MAYIATGTAFPDALSAGPAASSVDGPVILVNGGAAEVDSATKTLLTSLKVSDIRIVGGTAAVSEGFENSLKLIAPTTRFEDDDRYGTSVAVNLGAFGKTASGRAFLATGVTFPDALAGAAWAGIVQAPLFVTPTDCVPQGTAIAMGGMGVTQITLLGGPDALGEGAEDVFECMPVAIP